MAAAAAATMKSVTVTKFGAVDDIIAISTTQPKPQLAPGSKGQLLVRVQACSTTPGDWRTMSGSCDLVRKPAFPYIPSQDVCGIIEEVSDECPSEFKVGDAVIGTWDMTPYGGMAEYAIVRASLAVLKPTSMSSLTGAALGNSAVHALKAVRDCAKIKQGDRVLVLGGSGGVGSAIVQLAKQAGASYVAATSTDAAMLESLGTVDRVIDYRTTDWAEDAEFAAAPFDVIFDCAEGLEAWMRAKRRGVGAVLKSGKDGGRFIAIHPPRPDQEFRTMGQLLGFFVGTLWRGMWTSLRPTFPRWKGYLNSACGKSLAEVVRLVDEGALKIALAPGSPFPFTEEGAKAAYNLQANKHAHGKVVLQIAD